MNDKEKLIQAKKNYELFLNRLVKIPDKSPFRPTTLILKNDKTITSDYWNEHDISPTTFYYWLVHEQKYNVIEEVILDKMLFDRLTSMMYNVQFTATVLWAPKSFMFNDILISSIN